MRVIDLDYSISSTSKKQFIGRMTDIQNRSRWEEFSLDKIKLDLDEKVSISIGESCIPPYIAADPSIENIIKYCNENKTEEEPITMIEKIKNRSAFVESAKYVLTEFALNDLIDRAKLGSRFKNKAFLERNIGTLDDALWTAGHAGENCKIYMIDDIVFAIPSGNYQPLPIASLIQTMETKLNELYDNVSFVSGFYCHEIMYVDFAIDDKALLDIYQKALNQVFYKPKIILRMVTSNLGFSGANLYPMLEYSTSPNSDPVIMSLGERIVLMHKGMASLETFEKNIDSAFAIIENIPERLNKLNDIEIKHPIHCLINLADKCGVPAKCVAPVAETASAIFGNSTTNARQIYLLLSKTVNYAKDEKDKIRIAEKIGKGVRILVNNTDDVDITKIKWISLSNIVAEEGQDIFNDLDEVDASSMEQISLIGAA